jgi:hypothetical protein
MDLPNIALQALAKNSGYVTSKGNRFCVFLPEGSAILVQEIKSRPWEVDQKTDELSIYDAVREFAFQELNCSIVGGEG